MKKNKLIGVLLLGLAVLTVVGMKLNDNGYWAVYNYVTLAVAVGGGVALIKG